MGKKDKAAKAPKLSKKEAKRLAAEQAAAAEKAERKAAKKRAKNAKAETVTVDEVGEPKPEKKGKPKHPHVEHLDRVGGLDAIVNDPNAKGKARKAAKAELAKLRAEGEARQAEKAERENDLATKTDAEIDAAIKARLAAKREKRAKGDENLRDMQADVATARAERAEAALAEAAEAEAPAEGEAVTEAEAAAEAEAPAEPAEVGAVAMKAVEKTLPDAAEVVAFAKPSESQLFEDRTNGNGQYLVKRPADSKEIGYTRVTTYIDTLEDKSTLTSWKMRVLLEGVAAAEEEAATGERGSSSESPTAQIRELAHRRDVAIAKAHKADRKGKLVPGQLATMVAGAWSDFKKAMDKLADEMFEVGGGRVKAQKGTDIHALCDIYDRDGIAAVEAKLTAGEITPSDFADVEAYARATKALGLKVTASEQVIVVDDIKVGGRLDRVYLAKLPEIRDPKTGEVIFPGDTRARRYIGDIKTGRVDLGMGKIAQQLRMYADGKAYNEETGERTSHGANRTHGLLIHVPAGAAEATVHLVDLNIGGAGNKLSGEVRQFRNLGKRAYKVDLDLVKVAEAAAAESVTTPE